MQFDLYLNVKTNQYVLYPVGEGPGTSRPKKFKYVGIAKIEVI